MDHAQTGAKSARMPDGQRDRLWPIPSTTERGNTVSPAHEHLPDALGPRQGPWIQQRSCPKQLDAQQSAFLVEVEHDLADILYLVHVLTHGLPLPNAGCDREIGCVGLMIVGIKCSFRHSRTLLSGLRKVRLDWCTRSGRGEPGSN